MRIETLILANLVHKEDYTRRVLPFIQVDYWDSATEKFLFTLIRDFFTQYNALPTKAALLVSIGQAQGLTDEQVKEGTALVEEITTNEDLLKEDSKWLFDETETFCQDKALFNALSQSVKIYDGKDKVQGKGAIPHILQEALGVSFDRRIGHDYLEDSDSRYDSYHKKTRRVSFDLDYMNRITDGGLPNKTLSIFMAGTGVGKSLTMCHMAAACLRQHLNVLYITLELSEESVGQRIDANMMDVTMDDVKKMPKDLYDKRIKKLRDNYKGRLVIHEYPTATAGAAHFRGLLQELALKKNFKPSIIFIDYLNICSSSRIKMGSNVQSYAYVKAIAEELRGLAVEFDVPVVSATQVNRGGFVNTDPGLEDTSESFGLPATADFMVVLVTNEQLEQLGQIQVKQLKSRFGDISKNKKFLLGIDKPRMKLFDLNDRAAQANLVDAGSVGEDADGPPVPTVRKSRFDQFKV